jgi:hypothetical protein
MEKHPFDKLNLLAYAAGDVTEAKRRDVERHATECETCRAFLASVESEKAAFLAGHPFDATITHLPARRTPRLFLFRGQVCALAATFVVLAAAGFVYVSNGARQGFRVKGETSLGMLVKNRRDEIEKRDGREYFTGEKIQFLYSCGARNNFALIGMDTAGVVTTYFPSSGDSSMILEAGRDIPLPNSITLDAYVGPELFAGVFSDHRFSCAELRRRIVATVDKSSLPDTLLLGGKFFSVSYLLTIKQGAP